MTQRSAAPRMRRTVKRRSTGGRHWRSSPRAALRAQTDPARSVCTAESPPPLRRLSYHGNAHSRAWPNGTGTMAGSRHRSLRRNNKICRRTYDLAQRQHPIALHPWWKSSGAVVFRVLWSCLKPWTISGSKQYLNLLPPRRTPILAFKSHEPSTRTPARPRRPARPIAGRAKPQLLAARP